MVTSGITLGSALASLVVGLTVVAIVFIRLWFDYRGTNSEPVEDDIVAQKTAPPTDPREADEIDENEEIDEDNVGEHPNA